MMKANGADKGGVLDDEGSSFLFLLLLRLGCSPFLALALLDL